MRYDVFYRKSPSCFVGELPDFVLHRSYQKVTSVDASNLGSVFRIMNIVDDSDFEMPQKLGVRSMDMGDVVVDENGQANIVASAGWRPIKFIEFPV